MKTPEIFVEFARKHFANKFRALKRHLEQASIGMLFEMYVANMLFYCTIGGIIIFVYSLFALTLISVGIFAALLVSVIIGIVGAVMIFLSLYFYPSYLIAARRKSIETNLPFAANHMGALAASGIPPHTMFKLLTDAKEYGEIANEARRIVRNVDFFGMDITAAIRQVADRTPSEPFKHFLSGIIATTTTGGDLRAHLKLAAKDALSDYRTKRARYMESLATYADFYVGVLIAAPLFFISILSLLAIIGGELGGMPIDALLNLGIYGMLPILNIVFLAFVHVTQPSM